MTYTLKKCKYIRKISLWWLVTKGDYEISEIWVKFQSKFLEQKIFCNPMTYTLKKYYYLRNKFLWWLSSREIRLKPLNSTRRHIFKIVDRYYFFKTVLKKNVRKTWETFRKIGKINVPKFLRKDFKEIWESFWRIRSKFRVTFKIIWETRGGNRELGG